MVKLYIFIFICILNKSVKNEYGYNENNQQPTEVESSDKLFMQICIFENHAHDNFAEMDSQIENIIGFWDGITFFFTFLIDFGIINFIYFNLKLENKTKKIQNCALNTFITRSKTLRASTASSPYCSI